MKSLNQLKSPLMNWRQPKFGVDHYELRSGEYLFGELYWTKWLSDEAVAVCQGGRWTLDRFGFFRSKVIAIEAASKRDVLHFEFDWTKGGVLQTASGKHFHWFRTKTFRNAWALTDAEGNALFEMEFGMRWFKHDIGVLLHISPQTAPELPLLLCTCLYLGICALQDAAGVVAATTAAIG